MMDKMLRAEIAGEVRQAMTEAMELYGERWVSGQELGEQIACFSKSWLRVYGKLLPRMQVVVTEESGDEHKSGWCYPLHRILRMMENGQVKDLRL